MRCRHVRGWSGPEHARFGSRNGRGRAGRNRRSDRGSVLVLESAERLRLRRRDRPCEAHAGRDTRGPCGRDDAVRRCADARGSYGRSNRSVQPAGRRHRRDDRGGSAGGVRRDRCLQDNLPPLEGHALGARRADADEARRRRRDPTRRRCAHGGHRCARDHSRRRHRSEGRAHQAAVRRDCGHSSDVSRGICYLTREDRPKEARMRRRTFLGIAAVTPWLSACASNAITQANIQPVALQGLPAEVPAPLLRPGTQWQYTMRDGITGLVTDRATIRVTSSTPDGYAIDEDWQNGWAAARYDANLNPVQTKNIVYQPPFPRYEFPLSIGKVWSGTVMKDAVPAQRYGHVREEVKGSVAGWERITVPAG